MTKEIVRWAIVDENGIVMACSASEDDAVYSRQHRAGCTIVKLVGTLPEPPKKPRRLAPALLRRLGGKRIFVTEELYTTEQEAQDDAAGSPGLVFIAWPAVPNKDGFYEVPE